jgi:succinoglycan biosynthesis transport protein ExoP
MNTPNQESIKLSSPADDDSLGYGHLIGIVLKRWPWMLGAISISLVGALAIAITEESVYLSSMQLIVEPNFESRIDLENLDTPLGGKINDVDYATQLNVMRSEHFLAEALKRIERDYPNLTIKQVSKNFQLIQVTEKDTATRIFAASYEANNAKLTRDFLEALKTVYLEYNQRQQQERLSRGLDYINRQLESTRISLQSSQAALERFREQAKIVDPSTQAQKEIESLNSVTTEKQKIQADIAETQSKYQFLLKQLQLSPDKALIASRLSQSGKIQELLKQLQTTELELAERRTLFTEADPTLKLLVKKQQNQQQILAATVREITKNSSKNLAINSFADLQLGETDLSLISELLITNTNLQGLNARLLKINKFENESPIQI